MKTTLRILIFAAALAMAAVPVTAGNPDWPNGPDEDPRLETPDDLGSGRWYLYSYIPDENVDSIRPEEADLGSGIHADAAWQVTTGTPEVVIAVLDSGINWDEIDLINKIYLNAGELPIPEGAAGYDANEDGVFNMRDYTGDSRIDDANGNGRIDAGDLIRIFSDETDGDGNGYVDDIAGWDFYRHDNDPADDTRYGHGTGEAKQAAAETNNGHGGPGVCPECLILPVRVGDSFVAEANRFAQGVVFAADSGVGVILEALGAINNTDFARDAVAYALSRGISFAASAADENSFHHNYPANYNGTIYTNNVVYDTMERDAATSFMALDTCTNWGPKVTVSAASNNCSSGATGHIGGALGLIHSYGVELGLDPPLSPAEVMGLVTMSASDVYNPEGEDNERVYPSLPGWDKYFGHGRLNLRAALDLIADGMIPPEALVESPRWFGTDSRRHRRDRHGPRRRAAFRLLRLPSVRAMGSHAGRRRTRADRFGVRSDDRDRRRARRAVAERPARGKSRQQRPDGG
ncbi:MAG: S8 family serine peptidase [Deltaproteobacteria bacterium]|nr:S8 family serine peptidase [Deltaproteobacteria bacterium]